MKTKTLVGVVMMSVLMPALASAAQPTPEGWFAAGSRPKDYRMAIDRTVARSGHASATMQSIAAKPAGFGTLMQMCKADSYRGKRVRLTGYVRSQDVTGWAGLWFRIDGPRAEPLGFDNMEQRAIKGTSDWTQYQIVLDVPESAQELAFGILLTGAGQVWMDDLSFEVVGAEVPTTGAKTTETTLPEPTNLNFEE
jgi:hypothetical protein